MDFAGIIGAVIGLGASLLVYRYKQNHWQDYIEKRLYEVETKLLALSIPEYKTSFSIFLTKVAPGQEIATIKTLSSLGNGTLKELKEMVENTPRLIKAEISREEAFAIRDALHASKAEVDIR